MSCKDGHLVKDATSDLQDHSYRELDSLATKVNLVSQGNDFM